MAGRLRLPPSVPTSSVAFQAFVHLAYRSCPRITANLTGSSAQVKSPLGSVTQAVLTLCLSELFIHTLCHSFKRNVGTTTAATSIVTERVECLICRPAASSCHLPPPSPSRVEGSIIPVPTFCFMQQQPANPDSCDTFFHSSFESRATFFSKNITLSQRLPTTERLSFRICTDVPVGLEEAGETRAFNYLTPHKLSVHDSKDSTLRLHPLRNTTVALTTAALYRAVKWAEHSMGSFKLGFRPPSAQEATDRSTGLLQRLNTTDMQRKLPSSKRSCFWSL